MGCKKVDLIIEDLQKIDEISISGFVRDRDRSKYVRYLDEDSLIEIVDYLKKEFIPYILNNFQMDNGKFLKDCLCKGYEPGLSSRLNGKFSKGLDNLKKYLSYIRKNYKKEYNSEGLSSYTFYLSIGLEKDCKIFFDDDKFNKFLLNYFEKKLNIYKVSLFAEGNDAFSFKLGDFYSIDGNIEIPYLIDTDK